MTRMEYVYYVIRCTMANCQIYIFKKDRFYRIDNYQNYQLIITTLIIIKPRHLYGLEKKTDLDGKKQQWEPWKRQRCRQITISLAANIGC